MSTRWEVSEDDKRDRQHGNCCMYCGEPTKHKVDCVIPQRLVKVRMTVEYDVEVPFSWTQHDIEFHRNDSSWCANNAVTELQDLVAKDECICGRVSFEYVGEMSETKTSAGVSIT